MSFIYYASFAFYVNLTVHILSVLMQQNHFDQLLTNMRMDGIFVKENMHIKWTAETGIVENIDNIIKEYKQTRNLFVSIIVVLIFLNFALSAFVFLLLCKHLQMKIIIIIAIDIHCIIVPLQSLL